MPVMIAVTIAVMIAVMILVMPTMIAVLTVSGKFVMNAVHLEVGRLDLVFLLFGDGTSHSGVSLFVDSI